MGAGLWARDGAKPYGFTGLHVSLTENVQVEGAYHGFLEARDCGALDDCSETFHALTAGLRFTFDGARVRPTAALLVGGFVGGTEGGIYGARVGAIAPIGSVAAIVLEGSGFLVGSDDSAGSFLALSLGLDVLFGSL